MPGYLVSATLGWGGDLQSEFSFRPGHLPTFESNRTLLLTIVQWAAFSRARALGCVFLINPSQSAVNRFQILKWLDDLKFHFKPCSAQETRLTLLGFSDFRCASSSQVGFKPWGGRTEIFLININKYPTLIYWKAESVFAMAWKALKWGYGDV